MKAANVRSVLKALSAAEAVDWNAAESGAADDISRSLLRELKVIAQISAVHNNAPRFPSAPAGSRVLPFSKSEDTLAATAATAARWGALILRGRLGHGADGDVYRAFDDRLQREVALKVLRQKHDEPGVSRFLNEARLLARVRHANVVTVHGADVIAGQAGIWMELVSGATLHELVSRQGPFGAHEAALMGAELCRGLAAIHQAGILHRDIKAQNAMREDGGRIVLMDFSVSAADQRRGLAGTPLYIAPELFDGQPASPQSDVYSVGVLLYYLVTGSYPITGSSVPDIAQAHQEGRRTRLRDARADLPAPFVSAIDRALTAHPAHRTASAGELEAALLESLSRQPATREHRPDRASSRFARWAIAAAAALLISAAVVTMTLRPYTTATPPVTLAPEARPWVLVSAFNNRTADRDLDGVLEYALERELISSSQVRVASRPRVDDALRLMRQPVDTRLDASTAREVALRDGGIRTVINGRVDQIGAVKVLSASLVDVHSGATIASLSEEAGDANALQPAVRRLANRLREALGETSAAVRLSAQQLEKVTTPSLKALRLYTESYAAGERDRWPGAMNLARQAIEEDPSFAVAHIWLAWTMMRNRLPMDAFMAPASKAVELSQGASDWERMWITASFHSLNGDGDQALGAYEALVKLYPDHFWGVNNLVQLYARLGRDADAVDLALRVVELRPHDYDALYVAFDQLVRSGNLEQAIEYAHRIRESGVYDSNPSGDAWVFDAFMAWHRADPAGAISELTKVQAEALPLDRELRDAILRRVSMLFLAVGRPAEARESLRLALPNAEAHLLQATIADAVGDGPAALQETVSAKIGEGPFVGSRSGELGQSALAIWLLVRSGARGQAHELLAKVQKLATETTPGPGTVFADAMAGEVAVADGRIDDGIRLLKDLRWETLGPRAVFQAREVLADAFVKKGELSAAADALRTLPSLKHIAASDRSIWWMRCQIRRAEILQSLGRNDEAQAIAKELDAMLSQSEAGFPLAQRVRAVLIAAR